MVEFCTFGNPSKSYFCYCSELLSKQRERPLKQKKSRITLIDKIKDEDEEEEEKQKEENNNKMPRLSSLPALIFLGAIEDDDDDVEESLRTAIMSNETFIECVSVYIPTSVRLTK